MAFINEARDRRSKAWFCAIINFISPGHVDPGRMWNGTDLPCKREFPGAQCNTDCGDFARKKLMNRSSFQGSLSTSHRFVRFAAFQELKTLSISKS